MNCLNRIIACRNLHCRILSSAQHNTAILTGRYPVKNSLVSQQRYQERLVDVGSAITDGTSSCQDS